MTPFEMVALGFQIAELAAEGIPRAIAAADTVKRAIAEKRDPSPAEWAELQEVTDALHHRIQAATDREDGGA